MRVTSEMMVTGSLRRLQDRLASYERAQVELSSGRRVNSPSDDPAQAGRGLVLRGAIQSREQELRAATDARSLVERADAELQDGMNVLHRIRDLTVRAGSETGTAERQAIAAEIEQLQQQLVGVANSEHRGRALFAGFTDGPAVGQVAGTWTYLGDQGQIVRRVSEQDRVQVNVHADDLFGLGGGTDTFTALDDLRTAILADDDAGIQTGLGAVDDAMDRFNDGLSAVGASQNRIDAARTRTEGSLLNLRTELSDVEDVDISEAIMEMELQEVAYQATLAALGRALPDSLVSFLR